MQRKPLPASFRNVPSTSQPQLQPKRSIGQPKRKQGEARAEIEPPRSTRFQQKRSGNPGGRPRGARNLKTIFLEENRRRIVITVNDLEGRVTVEEAIALRIALMLKKGDPVLIRALMETPLMEKVLPIIYYCSKADMKL